MSSVEVANRVVEKVYEGKSYKLADWNTDATITIGEWKQAIIAIAHEMRLEHQKNLDEQKLNILQQYRIVKKAE
jgi:hypothetical protein